MGVKVRQKAMPARSYDVGDYPVERLQRYADETNRAIAAGLPVPLLDVHADVDDPRSALANRGWVEKAFVEDGWLGFQFDVTDDKAAIALKNGSVKFTSPEFREGRTYNGIGTVGPHIRHVALTHKPRNPKQGPFEIVGEGIARFSLEDEEVADEFNADEAADDKAPEATEPEATNPDLPTDDKAGQKMEAIVAQLSVLGVELPADWSFESEGAADILLAALKTAGKAKSEGEAKEEDGSDEPPEVTEAPQNVMFSEDEIASLPPKVRAAIERSKQLEAQVVQFSEERAANQREKAIAEVQGRKIFPALKQQFIERLQTVKFSESDLSEVATILKHAEMVEKATPPSIMFDEAEVTDAPVDESLFETTPGAVDVARAKQINDEIDQRLGYRRSA